uniref:C3H1-type domain-containing protein n=2 Tax=Parascaris univalens TaxID=6257 RepID=A0A915A8Z7_PARUN
MIDIVMTSPAEFENISKAMNSENDDERKSSDEGNDEEMEEGEIFDDDDNKEDNATALNTPVGAPTGVAQSPTQTSVAQSRKPRDFDREEAGIRGNEGSMLSSWMSGVKQRTKPSGGMASPTIDANEEYYGYGSASPTEGVSDKDYRMRSAEHADKDYRWGSVHDDDPHHGQNQDAINEFGDSDYRSMSPRIDRRRRRSPSPGYLGAKRLRGHSPPMRGGYRGRGFRGRWGDRQICKFFREGYCRDGENCSYSHDAADSGRKPELCKFYQQGFCKKGLQCPLLHGEYPCKAFHKGECSRDPCQFSHVPLNSFTQPIFDQMMKDDELASRIAIPQGPLKRRVLIPGGPSPNAPGASPVSTLSTVSADAMSAGVLPPPSVVVPTLSSGGVAVAITQPQLVIPPTLAAPHGNYPAFFTHHVLTTPTVVDNPAVANATLPVLPVPPTVENAVAAPQFPMAAEKETKEEEDEGDTSFNINKMLEQITSKVKKDDVEESPASPPMFNADADGQDAPMIPHGSIVAWKLIGVDDIPAPHSNIDAGVLQQSLTDSSLRNDPRIKKALSSQFDAFTNSLMQSVPQVQLQSTQAASAKEDQQSATSSVKPVDPRTVSNRDPRKRSVVSDPRTAITTDPRVALSADPRTGLLNDPRLTATNTSKIHEVLKVIDQTNGALAGLYGSQIASTSTSGDQLYASTLTQGTSRDHDHRTSSPQYHSSPPSYRTSPPQFQDDRATPNEGRRGSAGSGWMPQIHSVNDPRFSRRGREYGSPAYRPNYGNRDRDEREVNNAATEGNTFSPPSSTESATANASPGPISLREKRKNNEYDSPLSRVPTVTRWP